MTETSMQVGESLSVPVELGERSYTVMIGPGLLRKAGTLIAPHLPRGKTAVVTDENVAEAHLTTLLASLEDERIETDTLTLPAGESAKSPEHLFRVTDFLLQVGIERNDAIVAFGGGVVGDLVGFAAAIVRRGVNFVQVPTSLLAQVDSSVGGKTGINARSGKNLVGAFHQPALVLADTAVLDTLPERELKAGYAEIVKYGLLGDAEFFAWLERNCDSLFAGDMQTRMRAVETSCRAKAAMVAEDEREGSVRALLNLGHTFGHALEAATGYSDRLLHGEGVAIGMAMAYRFSERLGVCRSGCATRVCAHLESVGLPSHARDIPGPTLDPNALLAAMRQDKKASGGKLVFILARDVGDAYVARDIALDDVLAFLEDELAAARSP